MVDKKELEKPGRFSDFFLRASKEKTERVLKEVARKANEEQREVFTKAQLKAKTG